MFVDMLACLYTFWGRQQCFECAPEHLELALLRALCSSLVPCTPDSAACMPGLSNSTPTSPGLRQPFIPSYIVCSDVHYCLRRFNQSTHHVQTVPESAAFARGLEKINWRCSRSRRAPLQSINPRGDMHDHVCCFTPLSLAVHLVTVLGLFFWSACP